MEGGPSRRSRPAPTGKGPCPPPRVVPGGVGSPVSSGPRGTGRRSRFQSLVQANERRVFRAPGDTLSTDSTGVSIGIWDSLPFFISVFYYRSEVVSLVKRKVIFNSCLDGLRGHDK